MKKQSFQVAGVDGCRAGWFVVVAQAARQKVLELKDFSVANTFADVLSKIADCQLVCVDIPIGLSDGAKPRQCDVSARKMLGRGRASSVFPPPVRPCLLAEDYQTASRISSEYSGKKLSTQSFFIMSKIREVDRAMTPELQQRVREIHPELAFWALAGGRPAKNNKKNLAGRNERISLLSPVFSNVQQLVAQTRKPKQVAPDDILDALAAVWTAGQAMIGNARTLPENPEFDRTGLKMEILYPAAIMDK